MAVSVLGGQHASRAGHSAQRPLAPACLTLLHTPRGRPAPQVNCLLLANYHGEEAGPAPTRATPGAGSESEDLSEGWDTEEEDSEGGLEGPEEGAGGVPEGRDGEEGDSEGEGGWAGGGGGGRAGLRRRGFAAGGGGAGDEGPSSSAPQDSQHRGGHGMHGSMKLDPFSLTFAMPEAERMFQAYYGSTMLRVRRSCTATPTLYVCVCGGVLAVP